jgi:glycosyltransferase involved in cell wall biosynthesis
LNPTKIPCRVALLANFIPPYQVAFYQQIAARVKELLILISTPMEPNRLWETDWGGLNVRIQKTITLRQVWKHPQGFSEPLFIHIPYDTLGLLHEFQPDWIISTELGLRTMQAVIYRKTHPSCRLIIRALLSEQTEKNRGYLRDFLRRSLIPAADGIMVNGKSGTSYIQKFGISKEKIFTIPYTIGMYPFLSIPFNQNNHSTHRLLYIGQFVQRKGILEFLSIFKNWLERHPDQQWELWCVGDGPLASNLREQSVPKNLSLKIRDHIPYKELPGLYSESGILIFPTLSDEWGVVVNEAMASGLPILGSLYSQAVEELVENDVTGWTFHPDKPEEVFSALDRALLCEQGDMYKMRVAARERISTFTPEAAAEALIGEMKLLS